ncbi:hypothetical protein [Olivibacter sp. XZL3]|uniref:hypothetical protein n=1 Tax=Olivibacter sp. XZL3 TaxID=1735116 RepID=UPI001066AF95|nr:hypothetical protein [Olivibacter sp. XZL3]
MKLHTFDRHALNEWKDTGYDNVNLTPSKNIGLTEGAEEPFTLLEPFLDNDKAKKYGSVVSITSPEIEKIIQEGSGKYYK